jgi:hypothetical protein
VKKSSNKHSEKDSIKTCLLLETPEAVGLLDDILNIPGIDMIHIGLNDLHLAMGMNFMFQLLSNGTVESLTEKIKAKGLPFGFGGIASINGGALPGSYILKEHYRLGSSMVILGRSFCNISQVKDLKEIECIFKNGIKEIRDLEEEAQSVLDYFKINHQQMVKIVDQITNSRNK